MGGGAAGGSRHRQQAFSCPWNSCLRVEGLMEELQSFAIVSTLKQIPFGIERKMIIMKFCSFSLISLCP